MRAGKKARKYRDNYLILQLFSLFVGIFFLFLLDGAKFVQVTGGKEKAITGPGGRG
jgi:hypothetical protein